jgi:hypothetical protein
MSSYVFPCMILTSASIVGNDATTSRGPSCVLLIFLEPLAQAAYCAGQKGEKAQASFQETRVSSSSRA